MMKNKTIQFNGPAILAAMFRELDPLSKKALLAKLQEASPILAKTVEYFEFQYVDLFRLEDLSMQLLLREVPEKDWLIAWKLTPAKLKDVILKNMSVRKRQDFEGAFSHLPRMHKAQVFRVQVSIAQKAKALLESGRIKIRAKRQLSLRRTG